MLEPKASRPYIPGYRILAPGEGTGLLPWSWATERLVGSHDYWLASVWPDGRPHVMPVWGTWNQNAVWFSSSKNSRKAQNLARDPRAVITTDNALEPIVVEGEVEIVTDRAIIAKFADWVDTKYQTSYGWNSSAPEITHASGSSRHWVFALTEDDFTGSPTRWRFDR